MACTGAYHDVPMGPLQHPGAERDTFIGLSKESSEIGRKMGITYAEDPIGYNLKVIDKLEPGQYRIHAKRYSQRTRVRNTRTIV